MKSCRGPSRVLKTLKDGMTVKRQERKAGANAQRQRGQLMSDADTRITTRASRLAGRSREPPQPRTTPARSSRCEISGRTYQMGSEQVHALHGVSFDIPKGEYIAIIGSVRLRASQR